MVFRRTKPSYLVIACGLLLFLYGAILILLRASSVIPYRHENYRLPFSMPDETKMLGRLSIDQGEELHYKLKIPKRQVDNKRFIVNIRLTGDDPSVISKRYEKVFPKGSLKNAKDDLHFLFKDRFEAPFRGNIVYSMDGALNSMYDDYYLVIKRFNNGSFLFKDIIIIAAGSAILLFGGILGKRGR